MIDRIEEIVVQYKYVFAWISLKSYYNSKRRYGLKQSFNKNQANKMFKTKDRRRIR